MGNSQRARWKERGEAAEESVREPQQCNVTKRREASGSKALSAIWNERPGVVEGTEDLEQHCTIER